MLKFGKMCKYAPGQNTYKLRMVFNRCATAYRMEGIFGQIPYFNAGSGFLNWFFQ
jgi:hypothetical protein